MRGLVPPHGMQPINPTMMMHIPPAHAALSRAPEMVRPPDWQPDSHVIIKEERPSPEEENKSLRLDDLEPGEIRSKGSSTKPAKVVAVGPNNRLPQDAAYSTMPMLQPAPSVGGMRLPVAAENRGHHGSSFTPYKQQEDENILDLTKKCEDAGDKGENSSRSTPSIPSGTSTPKQKKKSKFVLDSMVAKLWQNKMTHPDGSSEQKQDEGHVALETTSRSEQQQQQQQQPSSTHGTMKKETALPRDARRKGKPMKGDTSVNSDMGAGLQFTFINDSESGKMNLVGVSKPNPNLHDGSRLTAGSQWTQIGTYPSSHGLVTPNERESDVALLGSYYFNFTCHTRRNRERHCFQLGSLPI